MSAMAVTRQVDAQTIGRLYAESVGDLGIVRSVHVCETRDWLEIWVVTEPIDFVDEELLYQAGVNLRHRHPDAGVLVQVVNPNDYPDHYDLVQRVVPTRAKAVAVSR
jgi:hypothetical protein